MKTRNPGSAIVYLLFFLLLFCSVLNSAEKSDSDFVLELVSEKRDVYVAEPFKVTLIFKKKHGHSAVDFKFIPPKTKNFWIKEESQGRSYDKDGFNVSKQTYIMAAQRSGIQTIGAAEINIATRKYKRDNWGQWMPSFQWHSCFSNSIEMNVTDLPPGIMLVGDFNITAEVDRKEVKTNEAVGLTIKIKGRGNFEDIVSLKPSIPGVGIFEEEGESKAYMEHGTYKGVWRQKIAFVGQSDFTIPPIVLDFFDSKSRSVKSIHTQSIPIKVIGNTHRVRQEVVVEKGESVSDDTNTSIFINNQEADVVMATAGGLAVGLLFGLLPWRRLLKINSRRKTLRLSDHKAVLSLLLQHLDDEEAARMAEIFEKNLFEGDNKPIDKKALKILLFRLQKRG